MRDIIDNLRGRIAWQEISMAAATGLAVFALAWFGIELTRASGRVASVWFANAVLLALLLKQPVARWPLLVIFGYGGNIAANLQSGDGIVIAALLSACNSLEVMLAAAITRRFARSMDFRQRQPMMVMLASSAGAATVVTTVAASSVLAGIAGANFLSVAATWYPADALGYITVTPILLTISRGDVTDLLHREVVPKIAVSALLLTATVTVIFVQTDLPLLFLAFPALVSVVWLLGYVGGAMATVVIVCVAFVATLHGHGPIGLVQPDLRLRVLTLQVFTATAALTVLAIAATRFDIALLRSAITQAPDFFFVKNRRSEFVAVNQRVATAARETSVDNVIGKTDRDIVKEPRASLLLLEERQIIETGFGLIDRLESVVNEQGEERWFETTKVALKSETGRVIGLAGTSKDVTQRKALEEAVVRGRDELAMVLHEMSDGIAVISTDGYIVMCNEQYQRLFPITGAMRVNGAYLPRILLAAKDLGEQPNLDPAEAMARLKAGMEDEVQLSNGNILMARSASRANGGWIIVVSDVTRIRRAELEIRAMAEKLEILATTDGLTGLANRRNLDERVEREVARCRRSRQPIALMMIDIDYFKLYNDTYGHQAGDECLRLVGQALKAGLNRPGDFVARFGGEEFCVVLPDTEEAGAFVLGERLRLAVEAIAVVHSAAPSGSVTISCGVACMIPGGTATTAQELISRADRSLYVSKQLGRNKVTSWSAAKSAARTGLQEAG